MLYYHPVFNHACVAQLAEQLTRNEQVAGSNPLAPTDVCGQSAVVERLLAKEKVASSSLAARFSRMPR